MTRRWYPEEKPPSGTELYALLQDPIAPEHCEYPLDPQERVRYWKDRCALVEQQRDAALALIQRSANLYLRYYRWRHALLVWWRNSRC